MPDIRAIEDKTIRMIVIDESMVELLKKTHQDIRYLTYNDISDALEFTLRPFEKPYLPHFALGARFLLSTGLMERNFTYSKLKHHINTRRALLCKQGVASQKELTQLQSLLTMLHVINRRGSALSGFSSIDQTPGAKERLAAYGHISMSRDWVICAANREAGVVRLGRRHADIDLTDYDTTEQGFHTLQHDFVTRRKALELVLLTGQPVNLLRNGSLSELYSEGLY